MTQSVNIFESNPHLSLCSECNAPIITDEYLGETFCEDCGLIHSEKEIDVDNFSKNNFSGSQITPRKITNFIYFPEISYATRIMDLNQYPQFRRLARVDFWAKKTHTITLSNGIIELKRVCDTLQLPKPVTTTALYTFKKTHSKKLLVGYSRDAGVDCSIYYACRIYSIPVFYQEILNQNSVSEKRFRNLFHLILRTFNLKIPPLSLKILLSKVIYDLESNLGFEKKAAYLLDMIPDSYIIGKNPRCICAGILYLTSKLTQQNLLQKNIAKACYISETALRYTYKEIKEIILIK